MAKTGNGHVRRILVTVLDAANATGETVLLSQRTGIHTDDGPMFHELQHEGMRHSLGWLDEQA